MKQLGSRVWVVVVAVLGALLQSASLRGAFVFDDHQTIEGHVGVTGPFSWWNLFARRYWGTPFGVANREGTYRPLVTLTYLLDWHIGAGRPWVFHLTNLLLYAGVLLAIDAVLRRWMAEQLSAATRLLIVATFATLTIHVEVVSNITGRSELLAMLCTLGMIAMAFAAPLRASHVAGFAAFAVLALAAKESVLPMLLAIAALAVLRAGGLRNRTASTAITSAQGVPPSPQAQRNAALLFVVGIGLAVGFLLFRRAVGFGLEVTHDANVFKNPLIGRSLPQRLIGAAQVLTYYLEHMFTGLDLTPDYSYAWPWPSFGFSVRLVVGAGLAFLALLACLLALRARRRAPLLFQSLVLAFASYLVASHVLMPSSDLVADRVFFTPSLFVLVTLGLLLQRLANARRRLLIVVPVVAFAALQALLTVLLSTNWRDDRTLFRYAVATSPTNFRLRVLCASVTDSPEEAAWELLVAVALYRRFPAPLDPSMLPTELENAPMAARLDHLAAVEGGRDQLEALRQRALRVAALMNVPQAVGPLQRLRF